MATLRFDNFTLKRRYVILNLKVRLESLSTISRQVITYTDSFRWLLTCPFYRTSSLRYAISIGGTPTTSHNCAINCR